MAKDHASQSFNAIKKKLLESLTRLNFQHEARREVEEKNLLLTGEVSVAEVYGLVSRCRGDQYRSDRHHLDRSVTIHILEPRNKAI
jgi:hypothetical protein